MTAAEPPPEPTGAAQPRPVRISLVFDADRQTLGITAQPPPYPLSKLLSALPPEAAQVLGWAPDLAVGLVGVVVAPTGRAAGLLGTAGPPDSAEPSATLFLGEVPAAGSLALLVGLALDSPIPLGATPLFGALLDGLSLEDLVATWASAPIPPGSLVLPRPAPPPAEQPGYAAGPELSLTLRDGADQERVRLRPPGGRASASGASSQVPDPLPGPPVQWFTVGKRLGPLTVGRVGVVGTQRAFGLALDASLRTASLGVQLTGFTVVFDPRSEITPSAVLVALDGLAVAFGSGRLRIDGGLVRTTEQTDDGPVTAYCGALVIQAGPYGVAAVGSFAEYRGAPSMFVFGLARGRFGGVPAYFVTGLAAGFGYNRRLRLPAIDEVRGFPLVRAAVRSPLAPAAADAGSALAELSEGGWVPITSGAYWVAAGIAFTSFGVLDGFAMLVVQFGERFVLSLLGVLALRLPKLGPSVVYAELAVDAVLDVTGGEFRANAQLTPNSYVFHQNGRLAGGFAFRLWFGTHPRAGDFVVTIGGYHPAFDKPDWYPTVPRLGIDWRVSDQIGVRGDAYMAVTPRGAMAGGNLDLRFAAGDLTAWFIAHADLVVNWRPVFFDVAISVSVGASYTLSLGTIHRTLSIELGADLALWGPPFTGVAHVRWAVVSFRIAINGGGRPDAPGPVIDWPQFEAGFLPIGPDDPPTASGVCRPRAAAGLLDTVQIAGRAEWLVSGDSFELLTETVIPASRLEVEGPEGPGPVFESSRVGVYPLGSLTVETVHRVRLATLQDGGPVGGRTLDPADWDWSAVEGRLPYALWGTQNTGRAELGAELVPALTGLRGTPRKTRPAGPPPVPLSVLENTQVEPRHVFRLPAGTVNGSTQEPDVDPRTVVGETIARPDVVNARETVARLLARSGITSGIAAGRMNVLAERVADVFPFAPLLGPPGTTGPRHPAPAQWAGRVAARARKGTRERPTAPREPREPRLPKRVRAVFHRANGPVRPAPRAERYQDPWSVGGPRSARAYVFDHFAGPAEELIADRHVRRLGERTALRIDAGTHVLWEPEPSRSGRHALASDGAIPVRLTALDRRYALIDETLLPAGRSSEYLVPVACELLLVAGVAAEEPVWGWSTGTALLQIAPQALLGDRALVRPRAPLRVPCGGGRGTRGIGVVSGRGLSQRNRVETSAGTRPGWIDTRFPRPPAWLRISLRPAGAAGGSHAPAAVTVRRHTAPASQATLTPVAAEAADGILRLTYVLPDDSADGPLWVRVTPDGGWYADAVLGVPRTPPAGAGCGSPAGPVRPGPATVVLG